MKVTIVGFDPVRQEVLVQTKEMRDGNEILGKTRGQIREAITIGAEIEISDLEGTRYAVEADGLRRLS